MRNLEIIDGELATFKGTSDKAAGIIAPYDAAYQELKSASLQVVDKINASRLKEGEKILETQVNVALWNMENSVAEIDEVLMEGGAYQKAQTDRTVVLFTVLSAVVFLMVILASIYFSLKTTRNIVRSVNTVQDGILELSKGDLQARVEYDGSNEFGVLAEKLNFSLDEISKYAAAIDRSMTEFAEGDFTTPFDEEFIGDFAHIQAVIEKLRARMDETLTEVSTTAVRVDTEAVQISGGAQTLARGAAEQASGVAELSATVDDISQQITQTARYSGEADEMGRRTAEVISSSQHEMEQMMAARKDIAVVADEVRNLAQKSAEAAQNTAELIEKALGHVSRGEKLAESANAAFGEVADYSRDILEMVKKIAVASNEQATSITRVGQGIDEIAGVIQTNSAAAEESAAASQQLNDQADSLSQMLGSFRLSGSAALAAADFGSFTAPAPEQPAFTAPAPQPVFEARSFEAPAVEEPVEEAPADEPFVGDNQFDKY